MSFPKKVVTLKVLLQELLNLHCQTVKQLFESQQLVPRPSRFSHMTNIRHLDVYEKYIYLSRFRVYKPRMKDPGQGSEKNIANR